MADTEARARERRKKKLLDGSEQRLGYILGTRETPIAPEPAQAQVQAQAQAPPMGLRMTKHAAWYRRVGLTRALRTAFARMLVVLIMLVAWHMVRSGGSPSYRLVLIDGWRRVAVLSPPDKPHAIGSLVAYSVDQRLTLGVVLSVG
jgi:hypothetical protein